MKTPDSDSGAAKPVVDLEQLQSACDGDSQLLRDLMDLYFVQADQIMPELAQAVTAGSIDDVDHLSHKLAGASLACGMSALVPALRHLEHNAKDGHLQGAPEYYAEIVVQLEVVRKFMQEYISQLPP